MPVFNDRHPNLRAIAPRQSSDRDAIKRDVAHILNFARFISIAQTIIQQINLQGRKDYWNLGGSVTGMALHKQAHPASAPARVRSIPVLFE